MLVMVDICIPRVTLDIGVKLTDALRDLLVSHVDTRVTFFGCQVGGRWNKLGGSQAGSQQWHRSIQAQHDALSCMLSSKDVMPIDLKKQWRSTSSSSEDLPGSSSYVGPKQLD